MAEATAQTAAPALVTRAQIREFRGLTTLLSLSNRRTPRRPAPRDSTSRRAVAFQEATAFARLTVRADESVAVGLGPGLEKVALIATRDQERSHCTGHQPDREQGAALSSLRMFPTVALPQSSMGEYLLLHYRSDRAADGTPVIPAFLEHASVLLAILKRSHEDHGKVLGPAFDRVVGHYVWSEAEAAIRTRIAVGGAPQRAGSKVYRRNIFWALTQTTVDIAGHHGIEAFHRHPSGLHPALPILRGKVGELVFELLPASLREPDDTNLFYDRYGRCFLQEVLAYFVGGIRIIFEEIARLKRDIMDKRWEHCSNTAPGMEIEYAPEAVALVSDIDEYFDLASRYMLVLQTLLDQYGDDVLGDHFMWLQKVYGLRNTRVLPFGDGYFIDAPSSNKQGAPTDPGWDGSSLFEGFEFFPSSRTHDMREEECYGEEPWPEAAIAYLDKITVHQRALASLMKNTPTQNMPSNVNQRLRILRRASIIQNVQFYCAEVENPESFDADMLSPLDIIESVPVRRPARNPGNKGKGKEKDLGDDNDDDIQEDFIVLDEDEEEWAHNPEEVGYLFPQEARGFLSSLYGKEAISEAAVDEIMENDVPFRGQWHAEGLMLSAHLFAGAKTAAGVRGGHADPDDGGNPFSASSGVFDHTQHQGCEELRDIAGKLLAEFADLSTMATSQACCAGCLLLAEYIDQQNKEDRDRDVAAEKRRRKTDPPRRYNEPLPHQRRLTAQAAPPYWFPCTLPPWTPEDAAEHVILRARYEVTTWMRSQIEKSRQVRERARELQEEKALEQGDQEEQEQLEGEWDAAMETYYASIATFGADVGEGSGSSSGSFESS